MATLATHEENISNENAISSDELPTCFSPKELYKDLAVNGSTPEAFVRFNREAPILDLMPTSKLSNFLSYSIPTIDMRGLVADLKKNNYHHNLKKLHSACSNWGIFLLTNHGVDPRILIKVKVEIEEFYKLPLGEKMRFQVKPGESQGYGQRCGQNDDEKLDWCDRFYMIINPLSLRKPHLFPKLPSSLREALDSYMMEQEKVAMQIMRMMGRALEMEEGEIGELFEQGMQSMRMTYYPPHPQPERVVGITPHSDATGITILSQLNGIGGLQVNKDGDWIPVHVPPGAFVVNVGDVMEIVSNGMYKSVEHRVSVNSEKERMSIAMFFNPKLEAEVGPSPSLISPVNPPRFKTVAMQRYVEEYFTTRLDGKSYLQRMKIN